MRLTAGDENQEIKSGNEARLLHLLTFLPKEFVVSVR